MFHSEGLPKSKQLNIALRRVDSPPIMLISVDPPMKPPSMERVNMEAIKSQEIFASFITDLKTPVRNEVSVASSRPLTKDEVLKIDYTPLSQATLRRLEAELIRADTILDIDGRKKQNFTDPVDILDRKLQVDEGRSRFRAIMAYADIIRGLKEGEIVDPDRYRELDIYTLRQDPRMIMRGIEMDAAAIADIRAGRQPSTRLVSFPSKSLMT